jgi:hypothetical protein
LAGSIRVRLTALVLMPPPDTGILFNPPARETDKKKAEKKAGKKGGAEPFAGAFCRQKTAKGFTLGAPAA